MSLKDELKKKILDGMIKRCRPNDEFVVLVVDNYSAKIISSCCRMYDIMDAGVVVLENLRVKRERLDMAAIYFIEPTKESIELVLNDFADTKKPQYTTVHLFFTTHVGDLWVNKIATSSLVSRMKSFVELNCDFMAIESRVFSFERRKAIAHLFPEGVKQTEVYEKEIAKTAEQLVSVLLTLKEYPYIRFQSSSVVCQQLAKRVEADLKRIVGKLKDWKADEERERGTLLIVDRSIDPTAPLMHEYTYQAMLSDLLPVKGEICTIKTNDPDPEEKKANANAEEQHVLAEDDPLWVEYRHQHIGIVMSSLTQKFHAFRTKNAAATFQSANKNETSLKEMNAAIQALPQYQFMIRQYRKHMAIAETCMDMYEKDHLQELSELEQDMATGLDSDAEKVSIKAVMDKLSKFCQEATISKMTKLRLLMLYITTQGGIDPATRKLLLEASGIPMGSPLVTAITNLKNLGVDLTRERRKSAVSIPKERLAQFADRMKKITLKLMRYVPVLDEVLNAFVKDSLSRDQYPYIVEPPPKLDAASTKKAATADSNVTSLRSRKWRETTTEKKDDKNTGKGQRFLTFVVGGVTFSELRSVYEISQTQNVQLFIGSTETLNAEDYIRALGDLPVDDDDSARPTANKGATANTGSAKGTNQKQKQRLDDDDDDDDLDDDFKGIKLDTTTKKK